MDSKLRNLITTATEKSRDGKLLWQAIDSESFRARIGSGQLLVLRTIADVDRSSAYRYAVSISDAKGRTVVEADAVEATDGTEAGLLQSLFAAARTSALGGYRILDSMLNDLEMIP